MHCTSLNLSLLKTVVDLEGDRKASAFDKCLEWMEASVLLHNQIRLIILSHINMEKKA